MTNEYVLVISGKLASHGKARRWPLRRVDCYELHRGLTLIVRQFKFIDQTDYLS